MDNAIQWIKQFVSLIFILWKEIYVMVSPIQCLNNRDLVSNLSIKPAVSYGDHMYKYADELADLDFLTVSVTAVSSDRPKWLLQESKQLPRKRFPL